MTKSRQTDSPDVFWQRILALASGFFLALCLLKFGNPVILEQKIVPPKDFYEVVYSAWPIHWGYVAIGILLVSALPVANWKKRTVPWWIIASLLVWFGWQFVSATQTVDPRLTSATLRHFTACVVCFFIGYLALSEVVNKKLVWFGLLIGFLIMLKSGFEQHFGGLEQTRRYFELYIRPNVAYVPPDLLKKMTTTRIFGTMFYPNSLAGVILLVLPVISTFLFLIAPARLRKLTILALIAVSAAALFWSGSKAGWLLALASAGVWVLHTSVSRRTKLALIGVGLVFGLAGFGLKYAGFFQKGATSVVARTDYWRAAAQIVKESPLLGTGPGTFMVPYAKLKAPDAEMTRLCHNDYLQQASDSGLIGAIGYLGFVGGALWFLYRHRKTKTSQSHPQIGEHRLEFALWLGLAVLAIHSLAEFHLYIAGLAWPFFLLLGMLCGTGNRIDKPEPTAKVAAQ